MIWAENLIKELSILGWSVAMPQELALIKLIAVQISSPL